MVKLMGLVMPVVAKFDPSSAAKGLPILKFVGFTTVGTGCRGICMLVPLPNLESGWMCVMGGMVTWFLLSGDCKGAQRVWSISVD
jgi:hypothetical protein